MIQNVTSTSQSCNSIRNLFVIGRARSKCELGQRRAENGEEIRHHVEADAAIQGKSGSGLPTVLNINAGVEPAIATLVRRLLMGRQVDRAGGSRSELRPARNREDC